MSSDIFLIPLGKISQVIAMSYLKFDRTLLMNLEKSLSKEFLRTNRNGSYMSSSVVDCNTRKYHGYLVTPVPEVDGYNHVLLSSLDETVIQYGAEFNLGIHKYGPDCFAPGGHKYIREFHVDTVPTTIYRVGGVILKKERLLVEDEDRVLIRYTLLEAHSHTTLRLKPLLAFRGIHFLTYENNRIRKDFSNVENGVAFCLYDKYPQLAMQTSKKSKFVYLPAWNKGVEYPKEQERGLYYKEDLFAPGYFELTMQSGESVVFAAGTKDINPRTIKSLFNRELKQTKPNDSFENCLVNAAEQFFVEKNGDLYIVAGYPWFTFRVRDALLSLPGATLSVGNIDGFERMFATMTKMAADYISGNDYSTDYIETYVPDCPLWFMWNIQQYAIYTSVEQAAAKYGRLMLEVIDFIEKQKHPNLFVHDNGLLYTDGTTVAATWMNATENRQPITPRTGYIVELNALWYNALCFGGKIASAMGDNSVADRLAYRASHTGSAFVDNFWNGTYLYDYIDGTYRDVEVRPNMIFAVSLPYSPLDAKQQKSVLDIITRELLTVKGLRSLSPKSGMYRPNYVGGMYERNHNYHNGPVWPFLSGAYADAYMKVYKNSAAQFLRRFFAGYENELTELTVGTLSELYDGNPPFKGHGGMSYAPTVAEILRIVRIINNENNDTQQR